MCLALTGYLRTPSSIFWSQGFKHIQQRQELHLVTAGTHSDKGMCVTIIPLPRTLTGRHHLYVCISVSGCLLSTSTDRSQSWSNGYCKRREPEVSLSFLPVKNGGPGGKQDSHCKLQRHTLLMTHTSGKRPVPNWRICGSSVGHSHRLLPVSRCRSPPEGRTRGFAFTLEPLVRSSKALWAHRRIS